MLNWIEHELRHLWLARMEHRMHIERSKGYNLWIGKSSCRWSKDMGLANMGFGREKTTYCYFVAATSISFPLDSKVRKIVAKCAILVTVADDFFDEYGSFDELQRLTEAVQRWEGEGLSRHGKVIFDALDDLVCDITFKIFTRQGYDTKALLQDIWQDVFFGWFKESEWSRSRHAPSIDEYLQVGMISAAVQAMFLPACYFASPKHPQNSPGTHYSKITKLLMLSSRLLNDIQGYEVIPFHHHNFHVYLPYYYCFLTDANYFREMKDGKLNMVPPHLKENPEASIEDSIAYIQNKLERPKKQLLEITMSDSNTKIPKEWKLVHLCALKGFQMLFNTFNAFDSPTALLQDITMAIYEPLVMDAQRMLLVAICA